MFATEEDIRLFLEARKKIGIKPGLERMERFLEALGHPQHRLKIVHIAGTNGKGSTISYMQSVLKTAGYAVGTYTSPYFENYREQLLVNGEQIGEGDFIRLFNRLHETLTVFEAGEVQLTEFELLTAAAFLYFAEFRPVDLVLLETGMGGRDDATNICFPIVTAITNIATDHEQFLGKTIESIAEHKAGIIKSGVPVITTTENEEALAIISDIAKQKRAKLYTLHQQFDYKWIESNESGEQFEFSSMFVHSFLVKISMLGEHQVKNATLAFMILDYLKRYYAFIIEDEHLLHGFEASRWSGRGEIVSRKPFVMIDGAHNRAGMEQLAKMLKLHYPQKNIYLITALTKEKDVNEVLSPLYPLVTEICFTEFEHERASTAEQLFDEAEFEHKVIEKSPVAAVKWKQLQLKEGDMLLLTGSLYFLAELCPLFN